MPCKAVFLDVGWTLAYPERSIWEVFADVCRAGGAAVAAADCEDAVGALRRQVRGQQEQAFRDGARYSDSDAEFTGGFAQMGALVRARFGIEADADDFNRRFFAGFWTEGNWRTFPEVLDVIDDLRRAGARVGVLSNAPTNLPAFLDELGIAPLLDFAVVSAAEGVRKPDRRIFEVALRRAGVAPDEAMHVGDMYLEDVLGGRAAGVTPLLIERGERSLFPRFPESEGRDLQPDEIVRDLHAVRDRFLAER